MAIMVATMIILLLAALGVWAGGKVAKFSSGRRVTNLEMWRLGAEGGPTVRDREIAKRHLEFETGVLKNFDFFERWFLRLLGGVLGAVLGSAIARSLGVLT
jgi:hypothetical protein